MILSLRPQKRPFPTSKTIFVRLQAASNQPCMSLIIKSIAVLALFLFLLHPAAAQTPRDSNRIGFIGLPLLFYSPETQLGFGAGGLVTFRQAGSKQVSSVTFSFAYTLRRQILLYFPYQLYFNKGKDLVFGEVGWFKYGYRFSGLGNGYAPDFFENYTAQYPRLRATYLHDLGRGNFIGGRLAFDDFSIVETEAEGLLSSGDVTGSAGGRSLGAGLVWWTDTRNNRFFSTKGWFVESSAYVEAPFTGSDFDYSRFSVEADHFKKLGDETVLGLQGAAIFTFGDAPFFNQAQLGGGKRLRGYFEGKYRDRHLLYTQAELRQHLFKRFSGVVFGGAGTVFGTPGESAVIRPNAGAGLRFELDKKQKINIRLDYGFGYKTSGMYINIGEAF
jgi:hypothetical protein